MVRIVVLGDSIAKGYGGTGDAEGGFASIVAQKVHGEVTNLGIVGLDSSQLLEKMQTEKFQSALEQADAVFLSIGSNDLLKPFLSIIADAADVTGAQKELYEKLQKQFGRMSKEDPLKAGNALATAVRNINRSKELKQACQKFPDNFDKIISRLKTDYPQAVIYVNNIYNPYYGVSYEYDGLTLLNVHELCEQYITQLNKAFDTNSKDYRLFDMYSIFRQQGYTHVNPASLEDMSGVNFDPHPNNAGYQLMADYIYTQIDSIAPRVEAVMEEQQEVPVNLQVLTLDISERVRTVEGKSFYLICGDGQEYVYTISRGESLEPAEDGHCTLELKVSDFLGEDRVLAYSESYELRMEEGTVKDRGNNSPDELSIVSFQTEPKETAHVEANSVQVVNQPADHGQQAHHILAVSVLVFAAVAVAIAGIMLYNKRKQ